ncbi:MAG: DPP IV N-terminal domain-containing protein [Ferruginibacter sp.]
MKKILLFFLLISLFSAKAQLRMLTMEDAMVKARTSLAAENLKQLQFSGVTNGYSYLKKINGQDVFVKGDVNAAAEVPFLSLDQLNEKLKAAGVSSVQSMPVIQFHNAEWIMTVNDSRIALNPVNNTARIIIDKSISNKTDVEESGSGYVAYVDNNNLFVSDGKKSTQVTKDGTSDIVYAHSVHREEFGITKGTFWSNNGKLLAFYRMDQSMVADYPIIDWTKRPAVSVNIKYPMAGDKSHHVTVAVYNAVTGSTTWLKTTGDPEQYLTNIAWSPDDRSVFIAVLNRGQNHMWLNQYDAATGNFVKTLFEEKDDKYVEPLVPMLFVKDNSGKFIWQSNRGGWNHLYLYDMNGNLISQLTKGNWEVTEVKSFDSRSQKLFYVSTAESPVTRNLYSVDLKSGKTERITQGDGTHVSQVSDDGSTVIDVLSNTTTPRMINVIDIKTKKQKNILTAQNPLNEYALTDINIFKLKGEGPDSLYCRLYKPVNFDNSKKYPVIVYWYGGPHAQMINNAWNGGSGDLWFQYMAERGYVVFTVDTRGSDNRGRAFEQSIFRRLGDVQMQDMLTGIDYLRSQSFVDDKKMGLFGWSFGGFMTTDFMLNHPGIFKAAVAGGPVMNWQYYEVMYGERYMDTPQENPEGYEATNLIKQAGKLKDKLLLIHGLQDPVVVQENSVSFVRACIDKGVQVDYMIYPGHEHNVLGKDRTHLYQKVTDYFMEYLK